MSNYSKQVISELASELTNAGFRVFIAKSGTYGFYTDGTGERVVSFQVDYLSPSFGGNYKSKHCGTGWRIDPIGSFEDMLNAPAPYWATKGEQVKLTTLEQHLATYQSSSQYKELEIAA